MYYKFILLNYFFRINKYNAEASKKEQILLANVPNLNYFYKNSFRDIGPKSELLDITQAPKVWKHLYQVWNTIDSDMPILHPGKVNRINLVDQQSSTDDEEQSGSQQLSCRAGRRYYRSSSNSEEVPETLQNPRRKRHSSGSDYEYEIPLYKRIHRQRLRSRTYRLRSTTYDYRTYYSSRSPSPLSSNSRSRSVSQTSKSSSHPSTLPSNFSELQVRPACSSTPIPKIKHNL